METYKMLRNKQQADADADGSASDHATPKFGVRQWRIDDVDFFDGHFFPLALRLVSRNEQQAYSDTGQGASSYTTPELCVGRCVNNLDLFNGHSISLLKTKKLVACRLRKTTAT